MRNIINFFLFYVAWMLCAFYHNFYIALTVLCLAIINILVCKFKFKEIILILSLAVIGFSNDLLSLSLGIFEFSYTASIFEWSNIWLFSLWVMLLTTFNASLRFLKQYNSVVISIFGAIGGTISYYAALRIGVLNSQEISRTIIYLFINWAILFPLLYRTYYKVLTTI